MSSKVRKIRLGIRTENYVKALVVRYNAYLWATETWHNEDICFWGDGLLEAQEVLGIILVKPETVLAMIGHAKRRIGEKEAKKVIE